MTDLDKDQPMNKNMTKRQPEWLKDKYISSNALPREAIISCYGPVE